MTTKLKLPATIRLLTLDKALAKDPNIRARIKAADNNNIVEGYRLEMNPDTEFPYEFFAEINIDNDRLWSLFKAMMLAMPNEVSLITGRKDEETNEVICSDYQDKYTVYNTIEKYQKELTLDGFLQYGVIHQTEDSLEEVFVHNAKYIQYWGMDIDRFRQLMEQFSLYKVPNLEYVDSYPMVTTVLSTLDPDVVPTNELLTKLRTEI